MKLLNITTKYFFILIFTLLILWCAVFYFSLQWTIYRDIDEYLTVRQHSIIKSFNKNPGLISQDSLYQSDFRVKEITEKEYDRFLKKHATGKFKNTKVYDELEDDEEPFRKMESVFTTNSKYYELNIISSLLNSEELLVTILVDILIFSFIFLGLGFLLNRFFLGKLWKPFYETIQKIKNYKLDKDNIVKLPTTHISEFNELNHSIEELIQNNLKVYLSQKQFIENASHEIQTPLGVIRNKVDLLVEVAPLNNEQATIIISITEHIERLARLNKTLLLLSKIENNQFSDHKSVDIIKIIEECNEDFADLIEFKNINLRIDKKSGLFLTMNEDLARILFSNLIKNAVNHNINSGFITITIESNKFSIANSGKDIKTEPTFLFERFNKKSDNPQSIGLGLAIAKSICTLYNFNISYSYSEKQHLLIILF